MDIVGLVWIISQYISVSLSSGFHGLVYRIVSVLAQAIVQFRVDLLSNGPKILIRYIFVLQSADHVPWCMSGSLTRSGRETFPVIPVHAQPTILRIWQEAKGKHKT